MRTPTRIVAIVFVVFGAALLAASQTSPQAPAKPGSAPSGQTGSQMQDHFGKVELVQDAVIRGDMDSAREAARGIAEQKGNQGLPAKSDMQLEAMQKAAQRAADAKDIHMVANAVATMASTCGTCHRSSGVTPKMAAPVAPPEGGGVAGHMLAHQQAVDYLYQGLITPSDDLWKKGAELLKASPMAKEDFPKDPQLTDEIKAFEVKTHLFANMAHKASDAKTRVGLYGELISSCAGCHALHGRIWGPGIPKM